MRRIYPSNYTSNLKNALKLQFKTEDVTSVFKLSEQNPIQFLSFGETEYTKNQKELRRQEKLQNALTASYTVTDKNGSEIKIRVPERLKPLVE